MTAGVLLVLLLPQVRERGLDIVSHDGVINTSEAPHAAAALRSSSEADVERVAAHMLAQEGVSGWAHFFAVTGVEGLHSLCCGE
jgi:hypothetical protein